MRTIHVHISWLRKALGKERKMARSWQRSPSHHSESQTHGLVLRYCKYDLAPHS